MEETACPAKPRFSGTAVAALIFAVLCLLMLASAAAGFLYLGRGDYRAEDAVVLLAVIALGLLTLMCAAAAMLAGIVATVQCLRVDTRTGRRRRGLWMAVTAILVSLAPLGYAAWAQLNAL
ncbi:hypothetical protein KIH77_03205 [Bifidobacterium sp. 82T24]|uniref:hypothetical protein n=1 Tax=Bifidobacterium pluvialisilvae TaxID=2834436 RepID=UPI001C590D2B|nr:hypothetical protein [Bifidobacterium pluvialisilvae]MBW3087743.1 hypothetical protein [Bifidobacterium pluvialisilvae]